MNYLPTFTFQEGSCFATYIDIYKYLSQKVAKNAHIYDIIMKMKKKDICDRKNALQSTTT